MRRLDNMKRMVEGKLSIIKCALFLEGFAVVAVVVVVVVVVDATSSFVFTSLYSYNKLRTFPPVSIPLHIGLLHA